MTMPTGSVIAGYTIERTLGAGGMGTVYLARHPTLPRSDALKVLSAELSADDQFRARFRREADLAASLDHPNIVRVYTRGETADGRLWIAMQFVDGTDAGAVLEHGPVPPERTAHIITQVGKALDYAHSRNLLHRDIKPANFLLAGPVGPYERVLLADFGIARALDDATRLTATGAVMATVAYASPESVEGKPLDHRSDLYSLGCALYRLLTNRTPYQGVGSLSAVMMAHVLRPPPRATEFAPWLPPGIDAVLAAAMAKDPDARYQSARELAAATEAALLGGHPNPVPAPPPGPPPPQWMTERTQTYPSGYFSGPYPHAQPPVPPATPPRRRRWWLAGAAAALVAGVVAAVLLVPRGGPEEGPYPAQTFVHTFGITRIDHRPTAVAALGPGDADVVLSLGVQPVALVATGARLPSWLADLVDGDAEVLARTDAPALAGAHPDLVIDTDSALTQQGYDTLNGVAPTITRPNTTGQGFGPRVQLSWIAGILGEQSRAGAVQNDANAAQSAVRDGHPQFSGKTISVFGFSDSGLSAALSDSPAASYLTGIGFTYNSQLESGPSGQFDKPLDSKTLLDYRTDVALILRTDQGAGGGGFGGLPSAFDSYGGTILVIDSPDTVAALTSAGPAASRYLNTALVDPLARQLP